DLVDRYQAAGVDQVIFVAQAGPNRHEHVCESIELFASTVLPRFAEAADGVEAAKHERLADARESALRRRPPARRAPADYVVTPQGESRAATAHDAAPAAGRTRRSADRARAATEALCARAVRGRSDAQLARLV